MGPLWGLLRSKGGVHTSSRPHLLVWLVDESHALEKAPLVQGLLDTVHALSYPIRVHEADEEQPAERDRAARAGPKLRGRHEVGGGGDGRLRAVARATR